MNDVRLRKIRAELASSMLPAVAIDGGCPESVLKEIRHAARKVHFARFDLAHRGRFEVSNDEPPPNALVALTEIVSACAGEPIQIAMHRWVRLRRGDYELVRNDAERSARLAPRGLDVIVDASETASNEAEVVFTHRGQAFFTMSQRPGMLAIVARRPTVQRYARYLTHRLGDRVVLRLELGLLPSGVS